MYNGRNGVREGTSGSGYNSSAGSQNEIEGFRFEGVGESKDDTGR
jgi:hypothetical protein